MGVLGSVVIGLYLLNLLMWIYLFLVLVGGFFLGVIWGVIVGYFKIVCGLNEVLIILLLNYIV